MKLESQFYTPGEKPPYYGLADDNWLIEVLIKDVRGNIMLGMTSRNDDDFFGFFAISEDAFSRLPFDELVDLIKLDSDTPTDWEEADVITSEDMNVFRKKVDGMIDYLEKHKEDLKARYSIESFGDGHVYTNETEAGPVPDIHKAYYVELEIT